MSEIYPDYGFNPVLGRKPQKIKAGRSVINICQRHAAYAH
jgi:hypothetical protein